jgi:hypothetical protein
MTSGREKPDAYWAMFTGPCLLGAALKEYED